MWPRPIAFLWSALFWLGLGVLFSLHEHAFWGGDRPLWPAIVWETLVQWGPYAPLTPLLFAAARVQVARPGPWGWRVLVLLGVLVGAVTVHILLRGALADGVTALGLSTRGGERPPLLMQVLSGFPFQAMNYVAVLGVALVVAHRGATLQREREAEGLRRQLVDARLSALRSQLQPHFLFNALHAVGVTARSDPDGAARMVTLLGDLLRRSMAESDRQEVALREELEMLQPYLAIQEMRFQDRLTVEQDFSPETMSAAVPSLALQPLVENAVRHGVEQRAGAGKVVLAGRRDGDWLEVRVEDDGAGPPEREPREGLGLGNLRARLQALHGDRHRLTLEPRAGGGTVVTLGLPWRPVDGEEGRGGD